VKNKKKLPFKILAGIIALALIFCILLLTNGLVGNPISRIFANKAMKQYVNKNYSSLDLEIGTIEYNFTDGAGSYMGKAKSKTSIDTKFDIYYRNGKVQRDDYKTAVLGMFNTTQRLQKEYSAAAKDILVKKLKYNNLTVGVGFQEGKSKPKLDVKFDKSLFSNAYVLINFNSSDDSIAAIAKVLTDINKVFVDNDYNFNKYSLQIQTGSTNYIMVENVTPADIEGDELLNLLQKSKNKRSESGMIVHYINTNPSK